MRYITIAINLILLSTISAFIFVGGVEAQETLDEEKPSLFLLDTCPYCQQLLEQMGEIDLTTLEYDTYEVSDSTNLEIMQSALQKCGRESPSVPLLYYDGECYVGVDSVYQSIEILAGIDTENKLVSNNEAESEVTESTDFADLDFSDEKIALADKLAKDGVNTQSPDMNWRDGILILIVPMIIISAAYLLLTRLKM